VNNALYIKVFSRIYQGSSGSSSSQAAGQAELQLSNISQQQWNWFQSTYLPQATAAAGTSNAQAATTQAADNNALSQAQGIRRT
jgi:hypothetical protein